MPDSPSLTPDPSDRQPDKATQSGGIRLNSTGDTTVGGDIVGRDKVVTATVGGDIVGRDKITTIITEDKTHDVAGLPNPYLGLRSFTSVERARYAGRERGVKEGVAKLTTPGEQRTLLFITGASGSGKSSFAQAGLLPALEAFYAQRGRLLRHAVFRPGVHPISARDDALKQLSVGGDSSPSQPMPVPVLIFDQFEELFTQSQPEERNLLFNWLAELPPFSTTQRHLIVTVRSDYLNELFDVKPLWEAAKQGVELRAMSAEELRDAILRPVQSQYPNGEKRLEPALVERLVQDAAGEATYLPLLQVTLEELWKKGWLALSHYGTLTDAIRQRADKVFQFVDHDSASPQQLRSDDEQAAILELFLSLVNVSPDDDPRRDVRISRVTTAFTPEQRHLTADLSRARLLSVEDERNRETVNIIHETLIRNWDRLRDGVNARRQQLRRRARFEQQLQLWRANNRSFDYLLLTNVQLAEARDLEKAGDIALRDLDAQELLRQSTEHAEAERQRELDDARKLAESERRRAEEQEEANRRMQARNRIITAVGVIAIIAAVAAGILGWQANHSAATAQVANTQSAANLSVAQAQQATAQTANTQSATNLSMAQRQARLSRARELAAAAVSNLVVDPERSILLALQAVNTTYSVDKIVVPEAEAALHQAVQASHVRLTLTGHAAEVSGIAFSPDGKRLATASGDGTAKVWDATTGQELFTLTGHTSEILGIAYSPDGTRLATASQDQTAKVWDATTGKELLTLTGHAAALSGIAFSPDGKRLATANGDGSAKVWDAVTGQELLTLTGHTFPVSGIAYSPDGKYLATASWDGSAKVWDAVTGQELLTLTGHIDAVVGIAFSPDGTRLATASWDKTAKVWDATTGQALYTLTGHTDWVLGIAFSPNGKRLATASRDGTAKVWDATTGQALLTFTGHTSDVLGIAFSPDGKRLATASGDGTAKVWELTTGQELPTLTGHTDMVLGIAFSPDGTRLATASRDGTAKVWDATTGQELLTLTGHAAEVSGIAFSPDGKRLATASYDKTAKVWDATTGKKLLTLTGHAAEVPAIAFSSDGKRLATASWDGSAKVWDATTGQELLTLADYNGSVSAIAYSPDGKYLATASGDGTAKVWDATTGKKLLTLTGHTFPVHAIAYSPDGKYLATASGDGTAKVWDATTGKKLLTLTGHTSNLLGIAYSPDGKYLATSSADKTAKVWDATTGQELLTLTGHTAAVISIAFSPDGKYLATASADTTARIYFASEEGLISLARSRLTRTWTVDECQKYLQLDSCPPTP